ncbi:MAG TPA: tRNA lysidine(34) synthetase TilS, partial [Chloroflexota bacterium]|nr:tRNA lysidine(34) synthetase TilS [Chloroflexota bacterium]
TDTETRFTNWPDDPWLRRALLHRHIQRLDPQARDVSAADLERLASDAAKRISVTANLELVRRGSEVILRKRPEPIGPFDAEIHPGEAVNTPLGRMSLRTANGKRQTGQRFQLPTGSDPTFTVRNRRDGDRFQPLGMPRPKKLKDFMIDRKIPAEVRDRIPLLVWNGAIVWVAGVEISEAFKVTNEGEGEIYEVSIEKEDQKGIQRKSDRQSRR